MKKKENYTAAGYQPVGNYNGIEVFQAHDQNGNGLEQFVVKVDFQSQKQVSFSGDLRGSNGCDIKFNQLNLTDHELFFNTISTGTLNPAKIVIGATYSNIDVVGIPVFDGIMTHYLPNGPFESHGIEDYGNRLSDPSVADHRLFKVTQTGFEITSMGGTLAMGFCNNSLVPFALTSADDKFLMGLELINDPTQYNMTMVAVDPNNPTVAYFVISKSASHRDLYDELVIHFGFGGQDTETMVLPTKHDTSEIYDAGGSLGLANGPYFLNGPFTNLTYPISIVLSEP